MIENEIEGFVELCLFVMEHEKQLTVAEVAEKSGLSKGTVYRVRNGKMNNKCQLRTFMLFGDAVGIDLWAYRDMEK